MIAAWLAYNSEVQAADGGGHCIGYASQILHSLAEVRRMSSGMSKPELARRPPRPFRRAVLRGMGILLPPLLTVVIFVWIWTTIENNVLGPVQVGVRNVIAWAISDVREQLADYKPDARTRYNRRLYQHDGKDYVQVADGSYVPADIAEVIHSVDRGLFPPTGEAVYRRFVEIKYLRPTVVVPVFICGFILVMYLLGKFMAAGIGRFFYTLVEWFIFRLPLVRNVYSSVKQVTDFMISERELEYTRVVAVEYPRKGAWSIGFVTGEGMLDIHAAANEPLVSVMVPTSPMSVTGSTITVLRRETIDLNITVDQAFQFIMSCGVVVPPQQLVSGVKHTAEADEERLPASMRR